MDDTTWELIEAERVSLAICSTPSAPNNGSLPHSTEWRVRDVAAHLAMTPAGAPTVRTMLKALIVNRGHLWAAGRDVAVAYAARPTDRLVDELRRDASLHTKPIVVSADNILLDLVVHGQDITVPLGITRTISAPAGQISLRRLWAMGWPFRARRRWSDVSLRAEDCDWSGGQGPSVSGPAAAILLLLTGRTAALDQLHGPGVETGAPPGRATATSTRHHFSAEVPTRRTASSPRSPVTARRTTRFTASCSNAPEVRSQDCSCTSEGGRPVRGARTPRSPRTSSTIATA